MFKKRWMAGLICGVSLLASTSASATSLEQMNFGDMVSAASACVIADVMSVTSERRDGQIVTFTTFKVQKAAFGNVGSTFTVATEGGASTMGRLQISEVVAGSPLFLSGQESLMLLSEDNETGDYRIIGMNQGLFSVAEGANGVNYVALPQDVGGDVSVDEAVDIILEKRANPSSDGVDR